MKRPRSAALTLVAALGWPAPPYTCVPSRMVFEKVHVCGPCGNQVDVHQSVELSSDLLDIDVQIGFGWS